MHDLKTKVDYYVARLTGQEADDAWHSLRECGPRALPYIERAFDSADNEDVKHLLAEVVCEYRSAECLPFLTRLLDVRNASIWRTALDGFVMLGGREAYTVLLNARSRSSGSKRE